MAMSMLPSQASSMRANAFKSLPLSTTATFMGWPISLAFSMAAWITRWASSSKIVVLPPVCTFLLTFVPPDKRVSEPENRVNVRRLTHLAHKQRRDVHVGRARIRTDGVLLHLQRLSDAVGVSASRRPQLAGRGCPRPYRDLGQLVRRRTRSTPGVRPADQGRRCAGAAGQRLGQRPEAHAPGRLRRVSRGTRPRPRPAIRGRGERQGAGGGSRGRTFGAADARVL